MLMMTNSASQATRHRIDSRSAVSFSFLGRDANVPTLISYSPCDLLGKQVAWNAAALFKTGTGHFTASSAPPRSPS